MNRIYVKAKKENGEDLPSPRKRIAEKKMKELLKELKGCPLKLVCIIVVSIILL